MADPSSVAPKPQNLYERQCPMKSSDSDSFSLFYKGILAANSLADFEANLLSFMDEVLQQRVCLFYSNVHQSEDKTNFILQRSSYSSGFSRTMLRQKFPTSIQLDLDEGQNTQRPRYWYEQQIDNALNFFSISSEPPQYSFILRWREFGNYIRCGMLLSHSPSEVYGILLYERPLYHPHLSNPLRLQQFCAFLSLALAHQQTVNYATSDPLTNLYRRYHFFNLAERQLYDDQATKGLLIIDIDFFKDFNGTYGRLKGDHCLQAIARVIKNSVRTQDLVARFGGEEFVCLVQSEPQQALTIAQRLHETIEKIRLYDSIGQNIPMPTVSIGIASSRREEGLNQLIERADKALYQARQNGRNQTILFK